VSCSSQEETDALLAAIEAYKPYETHLDFRYATKLFRMHDAEKNSRVELFRLLWSRLKLCLAHVTYLEIHPQWLTHHGFVHVFEPRRYAFPLEITGDADPCW